MLYLNIRHFFASFVSLWFNELFGEVEEGLYTGIVAGGGRGGGIEGKPQSHKEHEEFLLKSRTLVAIFKHSAFLCILHFALYSSISNFPLSSQGSGGIREKAPHSSFQSPNIVMYPKKERVFGSYSVANQIPEPQGLKNLAMMSGFWTFMPAIRTDGLSNNHRVPSDLCNSTKESIINIDVRSADQERSGR